MFVNPHYKSITFLISLLVQHFTYGQILPYFLQISARHVDHACPIEDYKHLC